MGSLSILIFMFASNVQTKNVLLINILYSVYIVIILIIHIPIYQSSVSCTFETYVAKNLCRITQFHKISFDLSIKYSYILYPGFSRSSPTDEAYQITKSYSIKAPRRFTLQNILLTYLTGIEFLRSSTESTEVFIMCSEQKHNSD